MLYRNLSGYFRDKYGKRLGKICIDGGFSCPNRDGTCGQGGCIYCGERGAGEHIDPKASIKEQVLTALAEAEEDDLFVAYFQNFTNTYADKEVLKERYDAALIDKRIRVLAIGTRPDCIDEEIAALIASYKDRCDVWVELGLQTIHEDTAKRINRGHTYKEFLGGYHSLDGINRVVHLINGLPGEDKEMMLESAKAVAKLRPHGVKIHMLYLEEGTKMTEDYKKEPFHILSREEYVDITVSQLEFFHFDTVIGRLTGDGKADKLVEPQWSIKKFCVLNEIDKEFRRRDSYQGIYFE